jgi:hypothetical protein
MPAARVLLAGRGPSGDLNMREEELAQALTALLSSGHLVRTFPAWPQLLGDSRFDSISAQLDPRVVTGLLGELGTSLEHDSPILELIPRIIHPQIIRCLNDLESDPTALDRLCRQIKHPGVLRKLIAGLEDGSFAFGPHHNARVKGLLESLLDLERSGARDGRALSALKRFPIDDLVRLLFEVGKPDLALKFLPICGNDREAVKLVIGTMERVDSPRLLGVLIDHPELLYGSGFAREHLRARFAKLLANNEVAPDKVIKIARVLALHYSEAPCMKALLHLVA